jgi:hypothetical protein
MNRAFNDQRDSEKVTKALWVEPEVKRIPISATAQGENAGSEAGIKTPATVDPVS